MGGVCEQIRLKAGHEPGEDPFVFWNAGVGFHFHTQSWQIGRVAVYHYHAMLVALEELSSDR